MFIIRTRQRFCEFFHSSQPVCQLLAFSLKCFFYNSLIIKVIRYTCRNLQILINSFTFWRMIFQRSSECYPIPGWRISSQLMNYLLAGELFAEMKNSMFFIERGILLNSFWLRPNLQTVDQDITFH